MMMPDKIIRVENTLNAQRSERERQRTAFHEGGHAVMAHLHEISISRLWIAPQLDMPDRWQGRVHYGDDFDDARPEARAVVALAGGSAESFFDPSTTSVHEEDGGDAFELCEALRKGEEAAAWVLFYRLCEHTDALLRWRAVWVQVEAVALALLDRGELTGKEALEIMRRAVKEAASQR